MLSDNIQLYILLYVQVNAIYLEFLIFFTLLLSCVCETHKYMHIYIYVYFVYIRFVDS